MSNIFALALDLIGKDTFALKDVVMRSEETCERACDVAFEVILARLFVVGYYAVLSPTDFIWRRGYYLKS